ncbi:MAG: recombinase family protein [Gammaproteobacteria bacterium]|nr:recombinase family protein [Gammaproteobacteria bacterium]
MANYAYLRVSTDQQDVDNQRHGILEYANKHGIEGLSFIEDTVSGKKKWRERKLGDLVKATMKKGDVLVVAEISRLARSTLQVLEILEESAEDGLAVHIAKQNLVFTEKGDMTSTIMATVLGMVAQIEREFISMRTKEALAARKAAGMELGRPKGRAEKVKLDEHEEEIKDYLRKGISKRGIAKLVNCAPSTLYDWLNRRNIKVKEVTT